MRAVALSTRLNRLVIIPLTHDPQIHASGV